MRDRSVSCAARADRSSACRSPCVRSASQRSRPASQGLATLGLPAFHRRISNTAVRGNRRLCRSATNSPELSGSWLPRRAANRPPRSGGSRPTGVPLLAAHPRPLERISRRTSAGSAWYVLSFKDSAAARSSRARRLRSCSSLRCGARSKGIKRGGSRIGGLATLPSGLLLAGSLTSTARVFSRASASNGVDRCARGCRRPARRGSNTAGARTAKRTRVLADAFDHMLDRLEDAFVRHYDVRRGDALDELRTPLTVDPRSARGARRASGRPDIEEVRRVQRLVGRRGRPHDATHGGPAAARRRPRRSRFLRTPADRARGLTWGELHRTACARRASAASTLKLEPPGYTPTPTPPARPGAAQPVAKTRSRHTADAGRQHPPCHAVVAVEPARVRIIVRRRRAGNRAP